MTYFEILSETESYVGKYIGNYSQIVIDTIQNLTSDLDFDGNGDEDNVNLDTLGSWIYKIDILLEVYDPSKLKDIDTLTEIKQVLSDWQNDLKSKKEPTG